VCVYLTETATSSNEANATFVAVGQAVKAMLAA